MSNTISHYTWPSALKAGAALCTLLLTAGSLNAQGAIGKEGIFVSVPNPITSEAVQRIKNRVDAARNSPTRPVRTVVFDFNPGGKDAATPEYGECYTLANYINDLHGLETVAFVSATVSGHTVLPVLACKEVAMSP